MKPCFLSVSEVNETALAFISSRRKDSVFGDFVHYNALQVQTDPKVDGKVDLIYESDPQNVLNGKNTLLFIKY